MLQALDELEAPTLMEADRTQADQGLDAAHARLKTALTTLETRIEHSAKALGNVHTLKDELHRAKEENTKLKAEREDLKKAAVALAQKNEKLSKEIQHVSERLDMAIDKIGKVLES